MSYDIRSVIDKMRSERSGEAITRNPLQQFGTRQAPMPGATLLPERNVDQNMYREEGIRFRTFAAVPSTRYSPVTYFDGALVSSFSVELGESDIGMTLDAKEYDYIRKELQGGTMENVARSLLKFQQQGNTGLLIRNEIWRWQALVDARIRAKHGNVQFTVDYANPLGHRVTIPAGTQASPTGWYDPSYDPFVDIFAMTDMLEAKGYKINRVFTTRKVLSTITSSKGAQKRLGGVTINYGTDGSLTPYQGRATTDKVLEVLRGEGLDLPQGIERVDHTYNTRTKTLRYVPEDAIIFVCTTGQNEEYTEDRPDSQDPLIVPDTLGYTAIGTAAGQDSPGRVLELEAFTKKPPRVEMEGWQTSAPVITQPEAIGVIRIGKPTT